MKQYSIPIKIKFNYLICGKNRKDAKEKALKEVERRLKMGFENL